MDNGLEIIFIACGNLPKLALLNGTIKPYLLLHIFAPEDLKLASPALTLHYEWVSLILAASWKLHG